MTCGYEATRLYQRDFENGTVILDDPGTYCLGEDISFFPNSEDTLRHYGVHPSAENIGRVLATQMGMPGDAYGNVVYTPVKYGIGFFAAIAISGDQITIDLNGYTLEQAHGFALLQRFFAIIELGDAPFIIDQGPHDFGEIDVTTEVTIQGGTLGRSSHQGIHGNGPKHVHIHDIIFRDFEVAAISINGGQHIVIENVEVKRMRQDIPTLGIWSAGRFILPYLEYLIDQ
jgi:hypothetical protein